MMKTRPPPNAVVVAQRKQRQDSTSSGDDLIAQLVSAANAETIAKRPTVTAMPSQLKKQPLRRKAEKEAARRLPRPRRSCQGRERSCQGGCQGGKKLPRPRKKLPRPRRSCQGGCQSGCQGEKEAAEAAAKAEKEAAKAEKEAAEAAAKAGKEQQKTTEPRPTLVAVTEEVETETLAPRLTSMTLEDSEGELEQDDMSDSESSEDEAEVVPKNINGEDYLIDTDTNEVYDANTHELVGVWDKDNDKIITCEDME